MRTGRHTGSLRGRVPVVGHERHEDVGGAGQLQERVVQQLGGRRAHRRIAHQHLVEEALQAGRDLKRKGKLVEIGV